MGSDRTFDLDDIKKAIQEKFAQLEIVGEIHIKSASHGKLKGELERMSGQHIMELRELWGFLVVVDDRIPCDQVLLVQKRSLSELPTSDGGGDLFES